MATLATPPPRFPFALPRSETPVTTLLSVLQGAHSAGEGIFGFFSTREANTLRLVCGEFRDAVSEARWHDETTRISGSLAAWRACFPNARAANVAGRADLQDADFARLAGLKALNMNGCGGITYAGLAHLAGIHTLNISHLFGRGPQITDAGLAHLAGIHTLKMRYCAGITDAGLAYLAGIKTLDMSGCPGITDASLAHLAGVQELHMTGRDRATILAARVLGLHVVVEEEGGGD